MLSALLRLSTGQLRVYNRRMSEIKSSGNYYYYTHT
jgi:hypothetical protein